MAKGRREAKGQGVAKGRGAAQVPRTAQAPKVPNQSLWGENPTNVQPWASRMHPLAHGSAGAGGGKQRLQEPQEPIDRPLVSGDHGLHRVMV